VKHLALLSLAVLAACGGSGSTPPAPAATTVLVFVTPTPSATLTPTAAPTNAPTIAPTAVPASLKIVNGAPLASNPVVLSKGRRAQSQGVAATGLPILVESAGAYVLNAGPMASWVTNLVDGKNVAETSGTVAAPGFAIDSPTFAAQSCTISLTPWCAAHPLAWTWGTGVTKPLGKQTLTIAFGDGTSAQIFDYVYNGWLLTCGTGWAYSSGAIVPTTTRATSDVFDDCANGNIVFPHAAILASNPVSDSYGRFETIMPTITAEINITSAFVNLPIASVAQGTVFGIQTTDGGFAKVYFTDAMHGLALHANADGTYPY
jgi:hypothetical protein